MMVTIEMLEERPDGTVGIGGTYEVSEMTAREMIEKGEAKAQGHAIGVVPGEWGEGDGIL